VAPIEIAHGRALRAAGWAILTAAAEESHQLNSGASLATILNHIAAFRVGHAFLDLHCLIANKAAQQVDQRAFIVIQTRFFMHLSHFQPLQSRRAADGFGAGLRPLPHPSNLGRCVVLPFPREALLVSLEVRNALAKLVAQIDRWHRGRFDRRRRR
jgi:hypothetical protein